MARLGIDKGFLIEFAKLDRPVAAKVREVFGKFADATYTGIHLEPIKSARDKRLHSIRIDSYWRGVVLKQDVGDIYTLLTVRGHDEAYEWASRRAVTINTATGVIELRDVAALDELTAEQPENTTEPLFGHVKDSVLAKLGVDEPVINFARTLTDVTQLEASKPLLPQSPWDVLYGLAAGLSPDEVWAEIAASAPQTVDTGDVDAAVERSHGRIVVVNGPDELMSVFERPLDLWRVFLHPTQRLLAEKPFTGPARVTGGPGTGKTVVARTAPTGLRSARMGASCSRHSHRRCPRRSTPACYCWRIRQGENRTPAAILTSCTSTNLPTRSCATSTGTSPSSMSVSKMGSGKR